MTMLYLCIHGLSDRVSNRDGGGGGNKTNKTRLENEQGQILIVFHPGLLGRVGIPPTELELKYD